MAWRVVYCTLRHEVSVLEKVQGWLILVLKIHRFFLFELTLTARKKSVVKFLMTNSYLETNELAAPLMLDTHSGALG